MTYAAPAFPVGIRPGAKNPSAKALQAALKRTGYLSKLVVSTDTYGGFTASAVKKFHKAHPQFGLPTDGAIGPKGWTYLFHLAYDTSNNEPAHDYAHVVYGSKTVNVRTRTMMQRGEAVFGEKYYLVQGSYHTGVAASAGTHDGGGCIDVSVSGMSNAKISACVQSLRQVGFAAWHRTPAQGFSHHIHACAIGDRQMAYIAAEQVQQYFNGQNGLAGHGPDTDPPRPFPAWAAKYNH